SGSGRTAARRRRCPWRARRPEADGGERAGSWLASSVGEEVGGAEQGGAGVRPAPLRVGLGGGVAHRALNPGVFLDRGEFAVPERPRPALAVRRRGGGVGRGHVLGGDV